MTIWVVRDAIPVAAGLSERSLCLAGRQGRDPH